MKAIKFKIIEKPFKSLKQQSTISISYCCLENTI